MRTVSSVEVLKLGCRSASITWLLDQTADRSVAPDLIRVFCWRTIEGEESAMKYLVTGKAYKRGGFVVVVVVVLLFLVFDKINVE